MARSACALLALVLAAALPARAAAPAAADDPEIRRLNDDYVRAYLACDVARFRSLLADDFTGVLADGRVIDKAEFLREAAAPPDVRDLRLHDVTIREYGDTALVGALVNYKRADGSGVRTRYTTFYVRADGRWAIVWVQWTRAVAVP
ncbi:MAG TPA: nuclear transport factor 2 family protein [Opitutaceae bacterium]